MVAQYSNAEVVWVQEEPKNMGAWLYVKPRLDTAMRELFGQEVRLPRSKLAAPVSLCRPCVATAHLRASKILKYDRLGVIETQERLAAKVLRKSWQV